uniref:Peptidase S1 domain-containing protein n=1 Tax=Anopheles dirus TaxID=7168 RepID=A0A182N6R9_9DIPT
MDREKSHELMIGGILCLLLIVPCVAQLCGKRQHVTSLIMRGMDAKEGDWPWHAVLFHKKDVSLEYKCGGTILAESTVLTAAHCLVTPAGVINRELLLVKVGQNHLLKANNRAQEYDALKLILHPNYTIHGVRNDIALIKLANEITYNDFIQPICLWNRREDQNSIVNTTGTVIGFGYSDGYKTSLQEVRIPVVSTIECIEDNPAYGAKLTSGMFCAGNRTGVGPCNGDSGGGMFFNQSDVWYIRGLVSFTKPLESDMCDPNEYTVFTDVAKYKDWIEQHLPRSSEPANTVAKKRVTIIGQPSGSNPIQTCGKRKAVRILITHGDEADDGIWPWHAALFHNKGRQFTYACGGSILDKNTILTVASCLMTPPGLKTWERLMVQVGRTRLGQASNRMQEHNVFQWTVHPNFSLSSVDYDIGLIKLATDITYTDYIQPICLWKQEENYHSIENKTGIVIGYGLGGTEQTLDQLRAARIRVVSATECIETNRKYGELLSSRMFCAGYRNGTGACKGDSGGGLFFGKRQIWYIRGIVSFTHAREDSGICDPNEYTVFTDVAKYSNWIRQHLWQK